ncbi:helix-turn-helix domain-containing protein [Kurthia populi]|uniref:Helix-turn-helix domain-containing protein n=1 Tax=Kurthia populi TaxID=1562132 RepID=A0ABW5Y1A0_9BACL
MIKVHLSRILGEKRLSVTDLSKMTGLNRAGLSKLYNEKTTSISFETLEKVCTALECDITDLLEIQKAVKEND